MGQQQSLYQTLVTRGLAQNNPVNRLVAHGALGAQQAEGQRADVMNANQYAQRQRAPSQVLADREANVPAQGNIEQNESNTINRNYDELIEIPRHLLQSRNDSARVQRQSLGSGPSQFGKTTNSK